MIEDKLPEKFLEAAFHPSLFVYAFKRTVLDKLFDEFLASNIGIVKGEAWVASDDGYFAVIPLKNGGKAVLNWKIEKQKGEDWYDFTERSIKETLSVIADANLEKRISPSTRSRLYYNFELEEQP